MYRIAWMPGDGIGAEVMEAAKIVLDRLELEAEYVPADIGWEYWRTEGNPLPERTIEILKTCLGSESFCIIHSTGRKFSLKRLMKA